MISLKNITGSLRESSNIKLETKGLKNLQKVLNDHLGKKISVDVGYFAKNDRRDDGKSNVELAVRHEFGTVHMPSRPTLGLAIEKGGQDIVNNVIREYRLSGGKLSGVNFAKVLGQKVKDAVQEGYETAGFGEWAELSPQTVARKKGAGILRETEQLMKSVDFRVKEAE